MLWTLVLLITFPMLFACLMDSRLVKIKGFYKALLYLPALTSVVVAGTIFRLMFSELSGSQMNQFLGFLGFEPIKWLKIRSTSYFALLTIACWRWTGVNMLYFLAGLKNIDPGLYEAARIDGAGSGKKFLYITMPLLKPTTIYVLTISVYAGLAMFLESFMLWNGNSSPNNIGLTIVGYLYRRGIEKNQLGYASAVGLVLLVIALSINIIQLIMNGAFRKEER
jgi:arabinosaccharide transport system permease protein